MARTTAPKSKSRKTDAETPRKVEGMSPGTAASWTCEGAVSIGRIGGKRAPLPMGWESSAERASEDSTRDRRNKLRRAALIEFEVRRVPELSDSATR